MSASKKTSTSKTAPHRKAKQPAATLRSTSGAGFAFEDLISAWQLVKALSGEHASGIGLVITQLQAQVSSLDWKIDDLLLTAAGSNAPARLAVSAKGNLHVSAAGLPTDFVMRSWEQWRAPQGPFNRTTDGLALATLGTHQTFDPAWREVKNACSGPDPALAISRIRANKKQSQIFDSVQKPGAASDEETIELIRRLHVLPTDLQFAHSETETQAIARCRHLLASGRDDEARALWKALVDVAEDVRLRTGTITVAGLLSSLRGKFDLRHHPDYVRDWETLVDVTSDHKARIETQLPSGYAVPREQETALLQATLADAQVTLVLGESGSGKSALVKSVLDGSFPTWNQVWFGPETLKTALSAARRTTLPLSHELSVVLNATVKQQNVLVIDSAERIDPGEFVVIRRMLQVILPSESPATECAWRVVIVTQPQSLTDGAEAISGGRTVRLIEVEPLKAEAVKLALRSSSSLSWLTAQEDTVATLSNLRTLAWVIQAGAALETSGGGLASPTAIADGLWQHWTGDQVDVQALMMRLARREASFERSFALTELEPSDVATFTRRPKELPLRLNKRTNRIEFEHDLAADWARFQFLKQMWEVTSQWGALASNPLWTNALRMLGQFLLRQPTQAGAAWDAAFEQAEAAANTLAGDILLDALSLDPHAEMFLAARVDLLLANGQKHLTRLLQRFLHIATVPTSPAAAPSAMGMYMEAQYRSPVFGRWPPVLRFLIAHRERLTDLVIPALAKLIETWLTRTPVTLSSNRATPYRLEMAEIALAMARTVQVEKGQGVLYLMQDTSLYTAPLAGAANLPVEVGAWALELAGRREVNADVARRITEARLKKAKEHAELLKSNSAYRARHVERERVPPSLGSLRERLPPWPLGAKFKVDQDFQTACLKENGLVTLMQRQPDVAAEVLLALIIEDQPEREYHSSQVEVDLGLDYPRDMYPTAFWKSPFYAFFLHAPESALESLISLVNFCTERWMASVVGNGSEEAPALTLQFDGGSKRSFPGWWQVFDWPQSNDPIGGANLFCALDALERCLTLKIAAGKDISRDFETLFREGNSAALISVLVNVAKFHPALLKGPLAPLLSSPHLYFWDGARVEQVGYKFVAWSWIRAGEQVFNLARDWALALHRKQKFLNTVVELMLEDDDLARRLQKLMPAWDLPESPKEVLEFKLFLAQLDRANYQISTDPSTGLDAKAFVYPEDLSAEVRSWQVNHAPAIEQLLVPDRCERRLQDGKPLTDVEATYLFNLLQECEAGAEGDNEEARLQCRFAVAGTLLALGSAWLVQNSQAEKHALEVVRSGVDEIASTAEAIRRWHFGLPRGGLKFVAYAVTYRWLVNEHDVDEWETAVLRLLTSGDTQAAAVVVATAYSHRHELGAAWWRLLRAGIFWSGLTMLAPENGDGDAAEQTWARWLSRLRRFPLRGQDAAADQLDFRRVVAGVERLDFQSGMRRYLAEEHSWRREPQRQRGVSLNGQFLEVLFGWLIDGEGTGDRELDSGLALRIWDYDVTRAKARKREDRNEYDLPSQSLGYNVLQKLAALTVTAPEGGERSLWEPVLVHGPAAHHGLQHFIRSLFSQIGKGIDPTAFERVWRATSEYGLAADWAQPRLWFYGERLICDLLGFGHEDALSRLPIGTAARMKDVYQRWAATHLSRDDECVASFCHFLTKSFAAPLRLDGICWLAAMLKESESGRSGNREDARDALAELVATALSSDVQDLSQHAEARQALVDIAATLAAQSVPLALTLQERIRKLR